VSEVGECGHIDNGAEEAATLCLRDGHSRVERFERYESLHAVGKPVLWLPLQLVLSALWFSVQENFFGEFKRGRTILVLEHELYLNKKV
jgi:hypothetical protein